MPHPLLERHGDVLVGASILSADFAHIGRDSRDALSAGADFLHVDVMDGHFVPNLTMGPDMCRALRREFPDVFLDVHLMIERPGDFFEPFAKAGADHVTFHVEADEDIRGLSKRAHDLGMTVGVAINPPTPVEKILPYLDAAEDSVEMVLVMSIMPGFSGQAFQDRTLKTTAAVREAGGDRLWIQMDGGIAPVTAKRVRDAGCDVLASASAIFGQPREAWAGVISELRSGGS